MRLTAKILLLMGLISFTICASTNSAPNAEQPPNQMPKRFQFKKTQTVDLNYLLFLPKGYSEKSDKKWPLILFLHGAGERGTNIWKVAVHGPPKNVTNNPDFPFVIVSPQCPENQHWENDSLLALLDDVTRRYKIDRGRIYLTGLSMGGYGTWNLGLMYPERFAAIAPICGGGQLITLILSRMDKAQALKTLGVWAFHGAKDPVVPVEESQRVVDSLKQAGVTDVKLTIYPDAQHDSWTETYNNPKLYEWFLEHKRAVTKP